VRDNWQDADTDGNTRLKMGRIEIEFPCMEWKRVAQNRGNSSCW